VIGSGELIGRVNYFIGKDPTKWHANVPTYAKVTYHNVYPGIDLAFHDKAGHLESDIIVSPGANLANFLMRFEGADRLTLGPSGDLVAITKSGRLCLHRPVAYQGEKDDKRTVLASYVVRGDREIGFRVDPFDRSQALVIDPEITYLPDGQESQQVTTAPGFDTTEDAVRPRPQFIDSSGNVWVAGSTNEYYFPTTARAYETTYPSGNTQAGVICKLNSTLSELIYSTFLGASQSSGTVTMGGPFVDSSGNVYVAGSTTDYYFPTTAGAYEPTFPEGGQAGFITKLNSTLSELIYSTFLGVPETGGTVTIGGFKVDSSGNVYVAGSTNEPYFPTTKGAYETAYPGGSNPAGFITKLNPTLSALIYSTFLGGIQISGGGVVTPGGPFVDSSGNVYVAGTTNEVSFPTTARAYETSYPMGEDQAGFITELNPTLSALIHSTFLGTTVLTGQGYVTIGGFKVDSSGNVYVAGSTNEVNFPTTKGAYETTYPFDTTFAGFITKLNPTLSGVIYSTFLGESVNCGTDTCGTVTVGGPFVDSSGNVYVAGSTTEYHFPTTAGAYETTYPEGSQAGFITKLNPTLSALIYSTFLGVSVSSGTVTVGSFTLDSSGNVYVVGSTNEYYFPTTAGAYETSFPEGSQAGFITKLNPTLSALIYSTFLGVSVSSGTVVIH
jgi:hypothetical protein